MDSTPLPQDHPATVLQLFVDEHYARLRRAFPVYQHLETAVQLCVVNQVARSTQVTDHPRHDLVSVGEFVDCVYHVGGIVVDATPREVDVEKIRNDPCRKAFNRGGFQLLFNKTNNSRSHTSTTFSKNSCLSSRNVICITLTLDVRDSIMAWA